MDIGKHLKEFRQEKGISRESLSSILGISIHALAKYEQGQREPNIETLNKIAKALDVEMASLIVNQEPNTGEKIKYFREKAHLTQKELGKKVYKSEISIRKYESGKVNIPLSVQLDICRVLQIAPYELQAGFKIKKETNDIDLSKVSTLKLIEELNSREDFPIKIAIKNWK